MADLRYTPGSARLIVAGESVALIAADVPDDTLARIWRRMGDGHGLAAVLEALTAAFGTTLTAIPPFAVAVREEDGVRLALRGDIHAVLHGARTTQLSGAGVTTWSEQVVPAVSAVDVTVGVQAGPAAALPLRDGVVGAGAVSVRWADTTADAAPDAAAGDADADGGDASTPADADGPAPAPARAVPAARARRRPPAPELPPLPELPLPEPLLRDVPLLAPESESTSGSEPEPETEPGTESGSEPEAAPTPDPTPGIRREPEPAPDAGPRADTASDAGVTPAAPVTTLIDSAAVLTLGTGDTLLPPAEPREPAPRTAPTPHDGGDAVSDTTGYDHLWGATMMSSVEAAAVRAAADDDEDDGERPPAGGAADHPAPALPHAAADAALGDHDGETISVARARALRAGRTGAAPEAEPLAPPRMPAPGRLRLSTGAVVPLDRTVVIGRRPRSTRVTGTDLPHLVAVDSPQQDISRSHLELRVEGDSILATDLHSTNGTTLRRPGAEPVRLHPGERNVVVPGDVLDLGDGVTATVEDLA